MTSFKKDDRVQIRPGIHPFTGDYRSGTVVKPDGPVMLVRRDGDSYETWSETKWWRHIVLTESDKWLITWIFRIKFGIWPGEWNPDE